MSQAIDRLSPPETPLKTKLIVPSCSRSGTMALYKALKILGYKPYHMVEVFASGVPHLEVFEEGVRAHSDLFSKFRRLDRAGFDKWMGDYDCILEIPSYFGTDFVEAYASDPDVKFILTERDPARWVKSIDNTIGFLQRRLDSWSVRSTSFLEPFLHRFISLTDAHYFTYTEGTKLGDDDHDEVTQRHYREYVAQVKRVVPKERLLVLKIEDGLDWQKICPFLEKKIPDQDWPAQNTTDQFQEGAWGIFAPLVKSAKMKAGIALTPILGVAVWAGLRYSPGE